MQSSSANKGHCSQTSWVSLQLLLYSAHKPAHTTIGIVGCHLESIQRYAMYKDSLLLESIESQLLTMTYGRDTIQRFFVTKYVCTYFTVRMTFRCSQAVWLFSELEPSWGSRINDFYMICGEACSTSAMSLRASVLWPTLGRASMHTRSHTHTGRPGQHNHRLCMHREVFPPYLQEDLLNAPTHPLLSSGCCAHELLCLLSQFLKLLRSQLVQDALELAIQILQARRTWSH